MKILFFNAILQFMKITLGSEIACDYSKFETDLFEITSDTNQNNTSESKNDEVFSSSADEAEFSSTDSNEYVKTQYEPEYKNLQSLHFFMSKYGKVLINCELKDVETLLPTFYSENLEVTTASKLEKNAYIGKMIYLAEFRKDLIGMLFSLKNKNIAITEANLDTLKDIEINFKQEKICDYKSYLGNLKDYYDLITRFLFFIENEEKDYLPEFRQKAISKVQLKLENIDGIINMIDELQRKERLVPLDLVNLREEINFLKELLDEETKHYLDFIDFRRENFKNHSDIIKEKLSSFQKYLPIKIKEIFLILDELENKEPVVDDELVLEIKEFLKSLQILIDAYRPFLTNYRGAFNDIWNFNVELLKFYE